MQKQETKSFFLPPPHLFRVDSFAPPFREIDVFNLVKTLTVQNLRGTSHLLSTVEAEKRVLSILQLVYYTVLLLGREKDGKVSAVVFNLQDLKINPGQKYGVGLSIIDFKASGLYVFFSSRYCRSL